MIWKGDIEATGQSLGFDLEGKEAEAVDSEWRIRVYLWIWSWNGGTGLTWSAVSRSGWRLVVGLGHWQIGGWSLESTIIESSARG